MSTKTTKKRRSEHKGEEAEEEGGEETKGGGGGGGEGEAGQYDAIADPNAPIPELQWMQLCQQMILVRRAETSTTATTTAAANNKRKATAKPTPVLHPVMVAWKKRCATITKALVNGWIGTDIKEKSDAMLRCLDAGDYIDAGAVENKGIKPELKTRCVFSGHTQMLHMYKLVSVNSPYRRLPHVKETTPQVADMSLKNNSSVIIVNRKIFMFLQAVIGALHADVLVHRMFCKMEEVDERKPNEEKKAKWEAYCMELLPKVQQTQSYVTEFVTGPNLPF